MKDDQTMNEQCSNDECTMIGIRNESLWQRLNSLNRLNSVTWDFLKFELYY